MNGAVAAVDLGATSGRVIVGRIADGEVALDVVTRFPNNPVRVWEGAAEGMHWNILELYRSITAGLASALRQEPGLRSIGVDSWAVDYGRIGGGRLRDVPYHYRDGRTGDGVRAAHELVSPAELYRINGLQFLAFNTLYQLTADRLAGDLDRIESVLLIPDLIGYWLTGRQVAERTNASTTGLLDVRTGDWSGELLARLNLPAGLLPPLVDPGHDLGGLLPAVASELGAPAGLRVSAVGSHDTASAVVGIPARDDDFAYVSCGTWALVGVELEAPVVTEAGRAANFTNEGGVDGRVRYLHNVMGLWLQSECIREWERDGTVVDLPALLAEAAALPGGSLFDANDPRLFPPGDIPARIAQCCVEAGQPVPQTRAEFVRAIAESLAEAFARGVRTAGELTGKTVRAIHIVGGGSQNELLCRRTADRSGLPVVAGPVEATALGNVLVQARTAGLVSGGLDALRAVIARSVAPRTYIPSPVG